MTGRAWELLDVALPLVIALVIGAALCDGAARCSRRSAPACEDVIVAVAPTAADPIELATCPEPTFLAQFALHPGGAAHAVCRCPSWLLEAE